MNPFDAVFATGLTDYRFTFACGEGSVQIQFAADGTRLHAALGPGIGFSLIEARGPEALPLVTSVVQVIVKSDRQVSARFRAAECPALFVGKWPDSETFARILRAVTERNRYPMPEAVPGDEGGNKSMTAQGQTKKPGSHSHDRHR